MQNWKLILIGSISLYIGYGIIWGELNKVIPFAGPLNELGCGVISLTMGVLCIGCIDYKKLISGLL
jgi:hypothetical protein